MQLNISEQEFRCFQRFIHDSAGIHLADSKKQLVCGRLSKRVQAHGLDSFKSYFNLLESGTSPQEVQMAVDLLTTNETYFFREARHFELLRQVALAASPRQPFRVWSAASSTGEEAYSTAMVLADCLAGRPWEIMGSDISMRVLKRAQSAHYSLERTAHIPQPYLKRFCLKGTGEQDGTLLIKKPLRQQVQFRQLNLNENLPDIGRFDLIFLRNVLIYFNPETKRQVVERVVSNLKPNGYFIIGHSESLHQVCASLQQVAPSVYRKPG